MNKRIRKKKCRGEFKELAFSLAASYAKLSEENADDFVDKILDKAGELNMSCGGTFELDHCDLYIVTGRINTNETERKEKLVESRSRRVFRCMVHPDRRRLRMRLP